MNKTPEELRIYSAMRNAYPVLFMVFEQALDFTWVLATGTTCNTLLLRAESIGSSLCNFSDGRLNYSAGVATINIPT